MAVQNGPPAAPVHQQVAPTTTLTPTQFAAQATAKAATSYQQYQDYLATNMGRIDGRAITAQANGELASMLAPVMAGYQRQQAQGTAAVAGYTRQLSGAFGRIAPQISAAYGQAEQQQGALNTAVAAELAGNGGAQAAQLQATLTQAGQDTSPAAQAASAAKGAAGASYASGSAGLSALIQQGAAAKAYGATLPAIGTLAGYQALGNLNQGIAGAEGKAVATAAGKYPTLVNQLTGQALAEQRNQTTAAYDAARVQAAQVTNDLRAQGVKISAAKANAAIAQGNARVQIEQRNSNISQQNANTSAARASTQASHEQFNEQLQAAKLSDAEKKQAQSYRVQQERIGIDSANAAIKAAQLQQKVKSGGFTPYQLNRFNDQAQVLAHGMRLGGQYDANGNPAPDGGYNAAGKPTPALSYQDAYLQQLAENIPPKIALKWLNRNYPPGIGGRPAPVGAVWKKTTWPTGG